MVKLNKPAKLTNGKGKRWLRDSVGVPERHRNPKVIVTTLTRQETGITNLCKIEEELVREYVNVLRTGLTTKRLNPARRPTVSRPQQHPGVR